jgi:MoaA/NifB/PqqE/SkfB family radical SAM enzyme
MLHLLGLCNLECAHCYMDGAPWRREELDLGAVLRAIGDCTALGVGQLYVTGGEPLLYRGIADVLRAAADVPNLGVTVCTNGTRSAPEHVELLREVGARAHVSADGLAEHHDRFRRKKGAFAAMEAGVRAFTAAGIPVTIVTTISRENLDSLPDVVAWAAGCGAEQVRVQPLLDLGRGRAIAEQRLAPPELNHLLLMLSDLANTYRERGVTCTLIGVTRRFLLAHPCGAYVCNGTGCHRRVAREIKKIVVREDGTVLPEATNLDPAFAIGNLHAGSLASQVAAYFDTGYARFDRLCRSLYERVVPVWPAAVVPWDQLLAEHSHGWQEDERDPVPAGADEESGSCSTCTEAPAASRELRLARS